MENTTATLDSPVPKTAPSNSGLLANYPSGRVILVRQLMGLFFAAFLNYCQIMKSNVTYSFQTFI